MFSTPLIIAVLVICLELNLKLLDNTVCVNHFRLHFQLSPLKLPNFDWIYFSSLIFTSVVLWVVARGEIGDVFSKKIIIDYYCGAHDLV